MKEDVEERENLKRYRFFYHYNKANNKMTIHFKKECTIVKNIVCHTTCESKWNKSQPYLTMRGWSSQIKILEETAHIMP